jgi:hypothetical protein
MASSQRGTTPASPNDAVTYAQLTALQNTVNGKAAQTLLASGTTSATVPGGTPVGIVAIRQ